MASLWDRLRAAVNLNDNGAGWSNPTPQPQQQAPQQRPQPQGRPQVNVGSLLQAFARYNDPRQVPTMVRDNVVRPSFEALDLTRNLAQLGAAQVTGNQQAFNNAKQATQQSYNHSILPGMINPARSAANAVVSSLPQVADARNAALQKNQEVSKALQPFADQRIREIQQGVKAGQIHPQDAAQAIGQITQLSQTPDMINQQQLQKTIQGAGFNYGDSPFTMGRKFVSNAGQTAANLSTGSLAVGATKAGLAGVAGKVLGGAATGGLAGAAGALGAENVKPLDILTSAGAGAGLGAGLVGAGALSHEALANLPVSAKKLNKDQGGFAKVPGKTPEAKPPVPSTDPLSSLKQEALKYKSADEFVGNVHKQIENPANGKSFTALAKEYGLPAKDQQILNKVEALRWSKDGPKTYPQAAEQLGHGKDYERITSQISQEGNKRYKNPYGNTGILGDTFTRQKLSDLYNQAHAASDPINRKVGPMEDALIAGRGGLSPEDLAIKQNLENGVSSNRPDAIRNIEKNQGKMTEAQRVAAAGGDTGMGGSMMSPEARAKLMAEQQAKARGIKLTSKDEQMGQVLGMNDKDIKAAKLDMQLTPEQRQSFILGENNRQNLRVGVGKNGLESFTENKVKAPDASGLESPIEPPKNLIPTDAVEARTLKEAKPEFMDSTNKYLGGKEAAKTQNILTAKKLPKLDEGNSVALMDAIENGSTSGKFDGVPEQVRQILDAKHQELVNAGVDIGYLENYFPHKWQNEKKVMQDYQTLNLRAGIQNARELPTIAEGVKMGFKPVTTDYRQAIHNYLNTADTLLANKQYFNELKSKGLIAEAGSRPVGMQVIDAPGLPQPRPFIDPETGNQIQGNYYAKPDVAHALNKLYGEQPRNGFFKATGDTSKTIQQLTLAGGAPTTPLNSFGVAQWTKQALGGQPLTATESFLRSFSKRRTDAFFEKNVENIKLMEKQGVSWRGSLNDPSSLKTMGEQVAESAGITGKTKTIFKEGWDKLVEDGTFQRFLPSLQLDTFNKAYSKALKAGLSKEEAAARAGETVRVFNGQNSMAKQALKSKTGSDVISTFFFAPTFREQMGTFWVNNAKSLTTQLKNPAFSQNRKFMAGSAVLFGAMQAANMALNEGKTTLQNDNPNDRLSLSIPRGDGKSVAVPFLSSIATVPRTALNVAGDLLTGKPKEAGMEAKKVLSQLVRPGFDLATNQKYNGRQVYNPKDDTAKRLKDQAGYFIGQYNHPYIQATTNAITGKSSGPLETAATATELPLRFRNYDSTGTVSAAPSSGVKGANTSGGAKTSVDDFKTIAQAAFGTPEGKKFLAMKEADRTEAAKSDPAVRGLLNQYNAMKKAFSTDKLRPDGLDEESTKTLDRFDGLTPKAKDAVLAREKDAEYKLLQAKYNSDKADGTLSAVDEIKRHQALAKAQVGSNFDKNTRDLFGLNKTQVYNYITNDPNGKKFADQLLAYDDALTQAGLQAKNKFRDKYGNVSFEPKTSTGVGRGRGKKAKTAKAPRGIRVGSIPRVRLSKAPRVKLTKGKTTTFKSIKVSKPKRVKI